MNKTLAWVLGSLAALTVLLFIVKAVSKKGPDGIKVTAEVAKLRTITETVTATGGKLYPETEVKVGSPISGEVTELYVHEGDTVTKGAVLARIRADKNGAVAPRLNLPAIPGLESLLQQPRSTSTASAATITAPIGGTVFGLSTKKAEHISTLQMPGSELLTIADMSHLEVRVAVNENNIIKIAVGDSADVKIEAYNSRKFKGVVTSISNGGSRQDAQAMLTAAVTAYEVHIRIDPGSYADLYNSGKPSAIPFRPGMSASADIKTQRREGVVTVPVSAVTSRPAGSDSAADDTKKKAKAVPDDTDKPAADAELQEVVYIIKPDNTLERRTVVSGIQDMNYTEIISGLSAGEQVVTGPYATITNTLRTGKKVAVVPNAELQ